MLFAFINTIFRDSSSLNLFALIFSFIFSLIFLGGWLYVVHKGIMKKGTLIRYNRQAQLVHLWYEGKFVSYPWKVVAPYQGLAPNPIFPTSLLLQFPGNKSVFGNNKTLKVGASFIDLDYVAKVTQISRWEIIRRYMEEGLDAVKPSEDPEFQHKMTELDLRSSEDGLNNLFLYYVCMGWYVERVAKKNRDAFKWPDDIEAICAPDAREKGLLDGFDTDPIRPTEEQEI